jgi:hypothetical protein
MNISHHRTSLLWGGFFIVSFACISLVVPRGSAADAGLEKLTGEVAGKGWILYSALTPAGDYDLFLARPDGSQVRNITQTPQTSEYGGRFSYDGRRMMFRRIPKGQPINHDLWGAIGTLFIANADGSNPVPQAGSGELPWASWGQEPNQVACLYKKEGRIRLMDLRTRQAVNELPRQGIFQQLFWSGDGARLCGTANLNGQDWNVVSLEVATGNMTLLSRGLNCTPDWFQGDPQRVIYSNRTPGLGTDYGWTMLMQATADGKNRTLIYGERGRHIYYGCTSPDDQYVIFSRPENDGGTDAHMAIMRLADAPIIVPDDYRELKVLYPNAKNDPVLRLPMAGFEPHWTYVEPGGK